MRFSSFSVFSTASIFIGAVLAADPPCDPTDPLTPPLVCDTRSAFGGSLVVPDVIPSFLPTGILSLVYGTVNVGGAQQLSPSRVVNAPLIAYNATPGTTSGPSYLLIMVDPDSPSPAPGNTEADVIQWLQTDLTVDPTTLSLVSTVAPAAPYVGPNPAQGAGIHRFVALLYTQPSGFSISALPDTLTGSRVGLNLASFVSQNNLGAPVGGQFFKSTYDGVALPAASVTPSLPAASPAASSTVPARASSRSSSHASAATSAAAAEVSGASVTDSTSSSEPSANSGSSTPGGTGSQISGAVGLKAGLVSMVLAAGVGLVTLA